jgi:hypothetical protein
MSPAARLRLLVLCASKLAWGQEQSYTPAEFSVELQRVQNSLEADPAGTKAQLPSEWPVLAEGHRYRVSPAPLHEALAKGDVSGARTWLTQVQRQAAALSTQGRASSGANAQAAGALRAILSRPEFGKATPPSAWDRFLGRVRTWIQDWLQSIFAYAAQYPTGSQALFWALMIGAVIGLGAWLFRFWTRTEQVFHLPKPSPMEEAVGSWHEWLVEARDAAGRNDHRQAIRCAYWAGVARLHEERPSGIRFTDTPRERLYLLAKESPARGPLAPEMLAPIKGITGTFERCWYAKQPVGEEDVARCFADLEALGCRVS